MYCYVLMFLSACHVNEVEYCMQADEFLTILPFVFLCQHFTIHSLSL